MQRARKTSAEQSKALWRRRWVLLVPLALLLGGCNRGKGTVSGEVTYDGKPIPWGRITFLCQEGQKTSHSSRIVNGKYTIKDCPAGPVKISIESFKAQPIGKHVPQAMVERSKETGWEEPPPEVIGKHLQIPLKYADTEQSGLEYTVQTGTDTHNIPLKPE
jgi:hypothetical protein